VPELAELKLTADYVNFLSEGKVFSHITKNPEHKWKEVKFNDFTIRAESRGKELKLKLDPVGGEESRDLIMTMGMGGNFQWADKDTQIKHTHLFFHTPGNEHLAFVDIRRFGKWKWGNWNESRGPDPTTEYEDFRVNVIRNLGKVSFNKPIYEMLMDQRYFNGIGNYLRAEILYRIPGANPFLSAREFIVNHGDRLFELCKDIPLHVYEIGGGTIKDWENPFGGKSNISDFMKCYGNPDMLRLSDRGGRTFWYDPKWKLETVFV
jgi:endonuclease VIII-like 1